GQWLSWNLSSSDPSTVGEYRKKQGIHTCPFLNHIKNFFGSFINKRNCPHLDADHFGRRNSSLSQSRHSQGGASSSGDLQEFTAIQIQSRHRFLLGSLIAADVYFSGFHSRRAVKIEFSHRHSIGCANIERGRIRS